MELLNFIAGLWNEFLITFICSGLIGLILTFITIVLANKQKLISSIFVAIPMSIAYLVCRITGYVAIALGLLQLALKLL